MSIRDLGIVFRALLLSFTKRPLTLRRLLFLPLAVCIYLLFRVIVRLGRALDDLLFRDYREQSVHSPLFVIAFPRSGSTFLHRLLCLDEEQFTHHHTYQTLLPAVSLYRLVGLFVALDRRVAALVPKLTRWFDLDLFSHWHGIHPIGLNRAEEDEALFLFPVYTVVLYMLFPFVDELPELQFADRLPSDIRRRTMDFYRSSLQRHLYAIQRKGQEARSLLIKNVHSISRIASILETFPDARFVFVTRNPYQAVPSLLSLYYAVWRVHSPDIPKDSPEARALARVGYDYFRYLDKMRTVIPEEQLIHMGFEEMIADPEGAVERIYGHFGLSLSAAFRARLRTVIRERSDHSSSHLYSLEEYGLTEKEVYEELKEAFCFTDQDAGVSMARSACVSRFPPRPSSPGGPTHEGHPSSQGQAATQL
jgi:hypothetical protein